MTVTPLYIFDLDGTLALCEHRRHLLDDASDPDRWSKFFLACVRDGPNWPVISTLHALMRNGADVWIWSGRSGEVMNLTLDWLHRYFDQVDARPVVQGDDPAAWHEGIELCMRRAGDFTPDEVLKEVWLHAMNEFDRRRLVAVFDDRDKVVAMWRRNGVACFQVAPGGF